MIVSVVVNYLSELCNWNRREK